MQSVDGCAAVQCLSQCAAGMYIAMSNWCHGRVEHHGCCTNCMTHNHKFDRQTTRRHNKNTSTSYAHVMLGHVSTLLHRMLLQQPRQMVNHHPNVHRGRLVNRCMRKLDAATCEQAIDRPHTPREPPRYRCPGCQRPMFKFESVQKHIGRCCADLFSGPVTADTWEATAQHAAARQRAAQQQAVRTWYTASGV